MTGLRHASNHRREPRDLIAHDVVTDARIELQIHRRPESRERRRRLTDARFGDMSVRRPAGEQHRRVLQCAADLVVPAEIPSDVEARMRELAVVAFESLGCEGLARVDFFLLPEGEVVVN